MKYKCLVLDHDDTTVDSTPCIHYPAFLKILSMLRPDKYFTIEEFQTKNFSPGLISFYREELSFTDEEMQTEYEVWQRFAARIIPPFFPGMDKLIKNFKASGGTLCVVSHSLEEFIVRDYDASCVPRPDMIYGWVDDPSKCKPSPYPLREIMRITGYHPEEILMVDDLKPGLEMAKACGVKFAACSWSYDIPLIHNTMKAQADYDLSSVKDLEQILFSGEQL